MMDVRDREAKMISDIDYMVKSLTDILTEIVSAAEHDDFNEDRILNTPLSLLKIRSMLRNLRNEVSRRSD